MFHKALKLEFKEGTELEMTFRDGKVKRYNVAVLYDRYPQLKLLEDRGLFLSGRLAGSYGVIWNDDLDLEAETVYQDGITVREEKPPANIMAGEAVLEARAKAGLSQKELSQLTGIDQSDISKIERGVANPSVSTLSRIATALGGELVVLIR